ncbi:siphovirus ReqiPepy6 Gp37-like family protein [Embleya hyalina]|uniref:Gp28/Gp37-like domain-containing protein n=1 Tax=Embleya hyalina TaxID=516124 RepID=A0A401YZ15_9ACTN|nr:siphovirus ReqiPepy6 Gp37-like family protein [Embleya hyalina]GCD99866.1 hypothetical protein EHYA_07588 [Embleya hyalina]
MGYRIEVRDRNLNRVGEIDTWTKLDFTVRYCDKGYWKLLLKDGTAQSRLIEKGGGIAIWQDGVPVPVISGQVEEFNRYFTVEQHTGPGSVYISGQCDNKVAFNRLAWPDPTKPINQQYQAPDNRGASGPAGQALWWELDRSIGDNALVDRRVPGIVIGPNPGLGDIVADSLRFDVLGTKFQEWCKAKSVGYRFVWNPDLRKIVLDIFRPSDKSTKVRFSTELGNLREYTWTLTAPRVTRAIVACQGEGADRYIHQKVDATAEAEWGFSIESFVDRRDLPLKTDPATGLPIKAKAETTDDEFAKAKLAVVEAADAALKEGAGSGNFQIYPIDTEQIQFGRDYFVGDRVTVAVDGEEYSDIVREVNISVEDGGKSSSVTPVIGEQGTNAPLNLYAHVAAMRDRVRRLEARL